jgi:hypothetical protein
MNEIFCLPALGGQATSTYTKTVVWFVAAALWRVPCLAQSQSALS